MSAYCVPSATAGKQRNWAEGPFGIDAAKGDLELPRAVGLVASMLSGGVRGCVPGVAGAVAVPVAQIPHWSRAWLGTEADR